MVNGKVMVPRKKLQSVPDLLANGAKEEVSSSESIIIKVLWMIFLVIMFYLSLEMFLNIVKKRKDQVVGGAVGGMGGGEL